MSEIAIPSNEQETFAAHKAFDAELSSILRATAPSTMDEHFDKVRAEADQQTYIMGVRIKGADEMIDEIERNRCETYDKVAREYAMDVLKRAHALEQGLEQQAKAAGVLKPPMPTDYGDRMLTTMAHNLERQEVRALAQGWTRTEFVNYYEGLTDADAPAQVAWLESEFDRGFPTISLRDATDATLDTNAVAKMNRLLAERREARVPLYIKEVRALLRAEFDDTRRMLIRQLAKPDSAPATQYRFRANSNTRNTKAGPKVDGRTPETIEADRSFAEGRKAAAR